MLVASFKTLSAPFLTATAAALATTSTEHEAAVSGRATKTASTTAAEASTVAAAGEALRLTPLFEALIHIQNIISYPRGP